MRRTGRQNVATNYSLYTTSRSAFSMPCIDSELRTVYTT